MTQTMHNAMLMFIILTSLGIVALDVEGLGSLLYVWILRCLYQVVKVIIILMTVFFTVLAFFRRGKEEEETPEPEKTPEA